MPGSQQAVAPIESRRVVIKFRNKIELPYETDDWFDKPELGPWEELEARFGRITLRRMFTSVTADQLKELERADPRHRAPKLRTYFFVYLEPKVRAEEVAGAFSKWRTVEYAYVDFPTTKPQQGVPNPGICDLAPGHLSNAPVGVSAARLALFIGGDGAKQRFIDIEEGWTTDHVSIVAYFTAPMLIPPLPLTGVIDDFSRDHGTAVVGIVCGKGPPPGCRGLAPRVLSAQLASTYLGAPPTLDLIAAAAAAGAPPNLYDALITAISVLLSSTPAPATPLAGRNAVLLIEQQVPLVLTINGISGTINHPVEIHRGVFDLLRLAFALGITVVEPAGNGRQQDKVGFDLQKLGIAGDSGAIIVAGARSHVVSFPANATKSGHNRHPSSNLGKRIDCYAWGENVVAPSSSQQSPPFSTDDCRGDFGGTSAAAAIIAGIVLALQGIAQHSSLSHPLHPRLLRRILRSRKFGTPIYDIVGPTPNNAPPPIGVMPDLNKILQTSANGFAPVLQAKLKGP